MSKGCGVRILALTLIFALLSQSLLFAAEVGDPKFYTHKNIPQLKDKLAERAANVILGQTGAGIKTIAITEIMDSEKNTRDADLEEKLRLILLKAGRFGIADRLVIDKIKDELNLSKSDLIDPSKAKEIGKLHGVDAFIYGTSSIQIEKISGDQKKTNLRLSLKMIDVSTGLLSWGDEFNIVQESYWPSKGTAFWRSMIIPGWGQFYNRQYLRSLLFFLGAVGGVGGAVYLGGESYKAFKEYESATDLSKINEYYNRANTYSQVASGVAVLAGVIWIYNAFDASANTDETEERIGNIKIGSAFPNSILLGYEMKF